MNCPHCGAPNVEGTTTCQECGRPLPARPYVLPIQETNGSAIAGLVCGILGWTVLPVIGSLIAIVLGHVARIQIRDSGGRIGGDGLAVTGLVLGYSSIGLGLAAAVLSFILAVLFGFALPIGVIGCGLCAA